MRLGRGMRKIINRRHQYQNKIDQYRKALLVQLKIKYTYMHAIFNKTGKKGEGILSFFLVPILTCTGGFFSKSIFRLFKGKKGVFCLI